MQFRQQDIEIGALAATAQTLPFPVSRILSAASLGVLGTAGNTETAMTVVTGTPTGAEVQFTGTANVPLNTVDLGTAAAAGQVLRFRVVVPGDAPAYI